MALAKHALANLEGACQFFEQVSSNPRAAKVMVSAFLLNCLLVSKTLTVVFGQPVLRKMRERARKAFEPDVYPQKQAPSINQHEIDTTSVVLTMASALAQGRSTIAEPQTLERPGLPRVTKHNPWPVWQGDNNPEDVGDIKQGPPFTGQQQQLMEVPVYTHGSAAVTAAMHEHEYEDHNMPSSSTPYSSGNQATIDMDLNASWQNFMQMFYQQNT
jgi:hypothetical protein